MNASGGGERVGAQVIFQLKIKQKVPSRDKAIRGTCKKNRFPATGVHLGPEMNVVPASCSSSETWARALFLGQKQQMHPWLLLLVRSGEGPGRIRVGWGGEGGDVYIVLGSS